MVVALFALSLVMIVGGIAAVVQGFPYVRLESGLAMVIGGSTAASAGVILLGLAAVVMRLQRMESVFAMARGAATGSFEQPRQIGPLPASAGPALAGAAGLAGLTVGSAGLPSERRGSEPEFVSPALTIDPADRFASQAPASETEPTLPDLLPREDAARVAHKADPLEPEAKQRSEPALPEKDLFAVSQNATPSEERSDAPVLRSSMDDVPSSYEAVAPVALEPEHAKAEANELQVVGTYSSGGNTYVMFANGSIEADTPRGRFTFGSLDELKQFVEAGGENDARGAA